MSFRLSHLFVPLLLGTVYQDTVVETNQQQQQHSSSKESIVQGSTATMSDPFHPITSFDDSHMKWFCPPDGWKTNDDDKDNREGKDGWWKIEGNELLVAPPAKKDFWRKTYYEPLLVKDDAPVYYSLVDQADLPVTIETSFTLTPKAQFDQAGIMIRLDSEHWLKTGIEVVDEKPRLSCVVTNSFSDWSTQHWSVPGVKIRVHILPQHGGSFVVEAAPMNDNEKGDDNDDDHDDKWSFVRIAHMNRDMKHDILNDNPTVVQAYKGESAPENKMMVGIFAACPVDQAGMVATFHNLSIKQGSSFVHDA